MFVDIPFSQIKDRDNDDHFKKFTAEINKLAESTSLETSSLENALQKMTQELITKHESAEIEEQEKVSVYMLLVFSRTI